MKSFMKWGLIAFVGLAALGALFGTDNKDGTGTEASVSAADVSTPEPSATKASTPAPTPDPKVSVNFAGPSTVRSDDVVLKGTVSPAHAHVWVKGQAVQVHHSHWSMPVTHGDNNFYVVATRKGYVKDATTAVVTRELSAAEKAVIRQQQAERRANARALESARSYLDLSGFSKQDLYEQLSSSAGEGFTATEAQYAVDHVGADWDKEAVQSARSYLQISPMSRSELIDQLSSSAGEGFTYEEALQAVNKVY